MALLNKDCSMKMFLLTLMKNRIFSLLAAQLILKEKDKNGMIGNLKIKSSTLMVAIITKHNTMKYFSNRPLISIHRHQYFILKQAE